MAAKTAPNRSWLAKAKSIHDLGGHFYVPNSAKPWNEKRDLLSERKRQEQYRRPIPVAEEFERFYGSRMHDSWPLEAERTPEVFRLTLNSIDGSYFADTLASHFDLEIGEIEMPVDLLLHNPSYVRAARYGIRGELRFEQWETIGEPVSQNVSGFQFLSDWFHEQEGRIQWIAEIWGGRHWRSKLSSSLFLMVDATHATAVDRRRSVLEKLFGPAAGQLWQDVLDGVDQEGHPYIFAGGMEGFLTRRMRHYGIERADFRPEK